MTLNHKEIVKMYNWRQICFQYPQFCVHCGGFVEPGQNGSWNVSTKEVHHEKCPNYREDTSFQSQTGDLSPGGSSPNDTSISEEPESENWWACKFPEND